MNTSELTGELLREWVARANGWKVERDGDHAEAELIGWDEKGEPFSFGEFGYCPDKNWAQGGPIIDREGISLVKNTNDEQDGKRVIWRAAYEITIGSFTGQAGFANEFFEGPEPLIAAMRAHVASKFGDEVSDEIQ